MVRGKGLGFTAPGGERLGREDAAHGRAMAGLGGGQGRLPMPTAHAPIAHVPPSLRRGPTCVLSFVCSSAPTSLLCPASMYNAPSMAYRLPLPQLVMNVIPTHPPHPQELRRLRAVRDAMASAALQLPAVPPHLRSPYQAARSQALAAEAEAAAEKGEAAEKGAEPLAARVKARLQVAAAGWVPQSAVPYAAAPGEVKSRLEELLGNQVCACVYAHLTRVPPPPMPPPPSYTHGVPSHGHLPPRYTAKHVHLHSPQCSPRPSIPVLPPRILSLVLALQLPPQAIPSLVDAAQPYLALPGGGRLFGRRALGRLGTARLQVGGPCVCVGVGGGLSVRRWPGCGGAAVLGPGGAVRQLPQVNSPVGWMGRAS